MKNVSFHNKTEKEALEYTAKVVDFGVTLLVYSALNELLTAIVLLKQSRYYTKSIKRRANNILAMRNRKVSELRNLVMHQGFASSYWDAIIDVCENDINNLRNEIRKTLEENRVEDVELFSQTETARTLIEAAKVHFEEVIKDCNNKFRSKNISEMRNLNLFDIFREFYIINIFKEWSIICTLLYRLIPEDIDLNNESITNAFNVMAEKFAKGLYINDCLAIAGAEYPEFAGARVIIEK